jgi:flagellar secretion chaperone FliS
MSTYAPSPSAYRANAVMTASAGQLVVMLYDGARRFLYQASVAMGERQIPLAHQKLTRAEEIVRHLRATLDLEQGGEVGQRLQGIYTFCLRHMSEARFAQDPSKLRTVDGLLAELRDSWDAITEE